MSYILYTVKDWKFKLELRSTSLQEIEVHVGILLSNKEIDFVIVNSKNKKPIIVSCESVKAGCEGINISDGGSLRLLLSEKTENTNLNMFYPGLRKEYKKYKETTNNEHYYSDKE